MDKSIWQSSEKSNYGIVEGKGIHFLAFTSLCYVGVVPLFRPKKIWYNCIGEISENLGLVAENSGIQTSIFNSVVEVTVVSV